jgi:chemotaxis protein histidine kinase CheA
MSEIQIIETVLEKTARRKRWQRGWKGFWQGLLVGSCLWLIALVSFKLVPIPGTVLVGAAVAAVLAMVIGFVLGWRRRVTLLETARWVDDQQKLQERLSTALEVAATPAVGNWRELLVTDAARHATEINPRSLLPYYLPPATRWALLSLALAAGLGFVPEHRSQTYVQKRKDADVIKETGRTLAELTRRSLEHRPPSLESTRQALESVEELGDHLARAKLTRADALKDLANVTDKLREQARELSKNPSLKALEKSARSPNTGGVQGSADLQKQIESLQKSLEKQAAGADPKSLEKFSQALQKAKEAASALPDNNSAQGDAAREQLEKTLLDLAKGAKDLGLSLPSLEEAIAALAASQTDQMLRDLATTETELEKLQAMAKALAQMQAQAEKLGKDLAEQLQNGQAEAAQSTLEKMVEQLGAPNLTPQQLQKMAEEVSKAVGPAAEYGNVANLLKRGAQQMQRGEKPNAAQSLAQAAKELENLMQQLAEGQSIMASLDALQKAQMCIGNGQGWGQCNGPPRAGQGGGIGRGVGTWADDSRFLDIGEIKDRWDNSGVVRPDMDARGISDRGDAQLADSLVPTKVRGQINPGGPMPSITLRGVSIKGQSKVDFTEMTTAAQSEAQAALSQDQVPRAYQGAVRDYFDDLKK